MSLQKLTRTYECGGLRLTNIRTFIDSLKISWIKRLINTEGHRQQVFCDTVITDKILCWEMDSKSVKFLAKTTSNLFWRDLLSAWVCFIDKYREKNVLEYPIWGTYLMQNENLKKKSHDFINSGIVYFKDLVDEHGDIWGYESFVAKYSLKINFVDFYTLKKSIPRDWITTTRNTGCNHSNFPRVVDMFVNRIL